MRLNLGTALRVTALVIALAALITVWGRRLQPDPESPSRESIPASPAEDKTGLLITGPKAYPGYTLLAPMASTKTYLIDLQGRVVHAWESNCHPALSAQLLENGNLLRSGAIPELHGLNSAGAGGRVQEYSWEGELVWDFQFHNDKQCPHHDLTRLPNGNVLMIVWEHKTAKETAAAGRRPDRTPFLIDSLIEVRPTGPTSGEVVWEWHLWDHLIQEHDASRANYGYVAEHPELVDLNFSAYGLGAIMRTKAGLEKLRSIGYLSTSPAGQSADVNCQIWSHFNCVAYDPKHDQILVSARGFSEFWILDHSTTTREAAGHTGGRSGRGGDLLYRWGDPAAYRAGGREARRLFGQHDAHWIPHGLPGAGHVLLFNNGTTRAGNRFSSVEEVALPVDGDGRYTRPPEGAFGPDQPIWSYAAPETSEMYSTLLSGAQRLPNGNTLICSGMNGALLEVTPEKEVIWKYINPTSRTALFRARRYGRDFAGLVAKDLTPGKSLEELAEPRKGQPAQ